MIDRVYAWVIQNCPEPKPSDPYNCQEVNTKIVGIGHLGLTTIGWIGSIGIPAGAFRR